MNVSLMKHSIYSICLSTLLSISYSANTAAEETGYYISEELQTFMHSGPGKQYRIIGSVMSASPVTLLGKSDEGDYIQIQDDKGREGWIEAQALAKGQSRPQQINALSEQINLVSAQLQQEQERVRTGVIQLEQIEQQLSSQQTALSNAIKERDLLQQKLTGMGDETQMKWFLNGGMVAGGGVLLGLILSFISRKKKRSDQWM